MQGWMKYTKLLSKPSTNFGGVSEMYKICDGWNVQNLSISCRVWIWILQNLRRLSFKSRCKSTLMSLFWLFGLCLCVYLFDMYESSYAIIHKTGLYTLSRCCSMKENILSFALSPLCLVYMKFLIPSVIKLGCKRCIYWKRSVEIILFNRSKCL